MAIDFPNSPSSGDTYSANGRTWQWDGSSWVLYGNLIDPTVLKVDPSNNRVGINNTSPTSTLDVTGDLSVSSDVTVYGTTNGVGASFTGNLSVGANTDVEASIDAVESDVSTLQTDVTNINELQRAVQSGTPYTLVLADAGTLVEMSNASANTLTIPPDSSVAFPNGTQILVVQAGAGQTTLVAGSGVTIRSKDGNLKLSAQWCGVTLIKRNTDNWLAIGDLSA